jgi:uncharacterized protein YggT (Ycf19 family)
MRNVSNAFLLTLLTALYWIFDIIWWLVIVWVVISWILFFSSQTSFRWKHRTAWGILNQLNDIFSAMTYPVLKPFRRILPPHKTAGVDWSPMLLLLAIMLVRTFLGYLVGPILLR